MGPDNIKIIIHISRLWLQLLQLLRFLHKFNLDA